jgi:hypothetical protein
VGEATLRASLPHSPSRGGALRGGLSGRAAVEVEEGGGGRRGRRTAAMWMGVSALTCSCVCWCAPLSIRYLTSSTLCLATALRRRPPTHTRSVTRWTAAT